MKKRSLLDEYEDFKDRKAFWGQTSGKDVLEFAISHKMRSK